jgi:hypothetical protein
VSSPAQIASVRGLFYTAARAQAALGRLVIYIFAILSLMQDFSKKINIVVRKDIESWRLLNTVAHCSAYFGKKLHASFDTGDYFETMDGKYHPRNSQYPIVILEADEKELRNLLCQKEVVSDISFMPFTKAMTETNDDAKLAEFYKSTNESELELLGIGLFGENSVLKTLTKKLSLYK